MERAPALSTRRPLKGGRPFPVELDVFSPAELDVFFVELDVFRLTPALSKLDVFSASYQCSQFVYK